MYSLYCSPYLVLIGQLLISSTAGRLTSVVGEISRMYETNEITHKIAVLGTFSVIGAFVRSLLYLFVSIY